MLRALWLALLFVIPACGGAGGILLEREFLRFQALVGPAGGIFFSTNGEMSVEFPQNTFQQETLVNISELDSSRGDPVFGSFNALRVFEMQPAGLLLGVPALLTLRLSSPAYFPDADVMPLFMGLQMQHDEPFTHMPNQGITIDFGMREAEMTFEMLQLNQFVVGLPTSKNHPNPGDDNLNLRAQLHADFDWELNVSNDVTIEIEHGDAFDVAAEFTFMDGSPSSYQPSLNTGDPIPTAQTEADGRVTHTGGLQFEVAEEGSSKLSYDIAFVLTLASPGDLELPDRLAEFGEYSLVVRPEDLNIFAEEGPGITAGIGVSGLARAHFRADDPPTVGVDPLLYVTGPSNRNGVEVYAIQTGATGLITGTPLVDIIQLSVAAIPATGPGDDVVLVSAGAGPLPGVGKLTRALYPFGPTGAGRTHFIVGGSNGDDWAGVRVFPGFKDLVSFGGDSRSTGVSYVHGAFAAFQEYDPTINFFNTNGGALGGERHFPNRKGNPASVFVSNFTDTAIIVMDSSEGNNGQIWFHFREDIDAEASLVGTAESDPRQVRAKNGLVAISNYASDTITTLTWTEVGPPVPAGTVTPGPTALPNPLKIDMIVLDNGNTALAVASDTTDRWWIGEFDGATLVNQWEGRFGRSGGLADVVFLPGSPTYLAVALKGNQQVQLIETTLISPPQ